MSGTVDTRTVEMRFDNKKFESNVKESMSTLEKLKRTLKLDGASKGLKEVEQTSKKLDFRDLDDSIHKVGKKFSILETIATGALMRIGMRAADVGIRMAKSLTIDQVVAGWTKYAEKTSAVQTIMANLKDDAEKFTDQFSKMEYVNRQLSRLVTFADETSYHLTDMTSNAGKWVANGLDLEETVTGLEGVATWAALSGRNAQQAESAFYAVSKAMSTGYMQIKDWRSIEIANMATQEFRELAITVAENKGKIKKGAVTVQNFRESLSGKGTKGWLDKDVMLEVFKQYGEGADKVIEYMDKYGISSTTAIKRLEKEDKAFTETLGYRAFRAAQEAKTFSEVIAATADAVSSKWAQVFENIFGNYLEAKELWTNLSEDLWEVFAQPLDKVNEVLSRWKGGFMGNGPLGFLDIAFESGELDKLNNGLNYVTRAAAEQAVATDSSTYSIQTLADGSERLRKVVKNAAGEYMVYTKKIYESDKNLISGRTLLMDGFKNIIDTLIHDVEDEEGNVHLSLLGAFKKAFMEIFFGGDDSNMLAKKLWELTQRFKEFTDRLRPSIETMEKIKNIFKGIFTIFKIGYKFIAAVLKPFKELFHRIFGDVPKGALEMGDAMSTWVQKLEKFLTQSKVFEKISNGIRKAIDKVAEGINWLSEKITGLKLKDFLHNIRDKVLGFFRDFDFKGRFEKIGSFFSNIINQIKQVETGDVTDKLTPLQNFWIGLKKIFSGIWKFLKAMSVPFKKVGEWIGNFFTKIHDAFTNKGAGSSSGFFNGKASSPFWEGVKKVFRGIVDFFKKIGPALEKIGEWIGNVFRDLGDKIAEFAKDHDALEIIEFILKGGLLASLTNFFTSLSGVFGGSKSIMKAITKDLDAIRGVFKAYQREVDAAAILKIALAMGVLALSLWVIAQIPPDKMEQAAAALKTIVIAVGIIVAAKGVLDIFKRNNGSSNTGVSSRGGILGGLKDLMTSVTKSTIFGNDATAKFVKVCLGIALAAAGILILVKAIDKIADVLVRFSDSNLKKQIAQGATTVLQIIVAFGVFALLAGVSNKASSALFAALAAYVLVAAIGKLIDLMASLGKDSEKMRNVRNVLDEFKDVFKALGKVAIIAISIVGIIAIIQTLVIAFSSFGKADSFGTAQVVKQFGKNFTRIARSLLITALAIGLLALIARSMKPEELEAIVIFIASFIGLIGGIQAVIVGLAANGKNQGINVANVLKQFGKTFTRIALSLLVVAAAFTLFSWIKFDNTPVETIALVFGIFLAFGTILSGIVALTMLSKNAGKFADSLKALSLLFVAIGASLIVVVAAFWLFSKIKFNNTSLENIALIFGAFMLFGTILTLIAAFASKNKGFSKSLNAISVMFLAIAASLIIVTTAFAMFSKIHFSETSVETISVIFAGFVGLVSIIAIVAAAVLNNKKNTVKILSTIAGFIIAVAASLVVVAAAFAIMGSVNMDSATMTTVGIIFGGFIFLTGLLAILASVFLQEKKNLVEILATIGGFMVAVAASLVVVAAAFAIMGSAKVKPKSIKTAGIVFGGFIVLTGLLAILAGVLIKDKRQLIGMLGVAAVMIAVAAAILIFAQAVVAIAQGVKPNQLETVETILITLGIIMGALIALGIIAGVIPGASIGLLAIAALIIAIGAACGIAAGGLASLVDSLTDFINVVADRGPEFSANIDAVISGFVESFTQAGSDFLQWIIDSGPKLTEAIVTVVTALAKALIESAPIIAYAVSYTLLQCIVSFLNALSDAIPDIVKALIRFIKTLAKVISDRGPDIIDAIFDLLFSILEAIGLWFMDLWDKFKEGIKKLDQYVKDQIQLQIELGDNPRVDLPAVDVHMESLQESVDNANKDVREILNKLKTGEITKEQADSEIQQYYDINRRFFRGETYDMLQKAGIELDRNKVISAEKAAAQKMIDVFTSGEEYVYESYFDEAGNLQQKTRKYTEEYLVQDVLGQYEVLKHLSPDIAEEYLSFFSDLGIEALSNADHITLKEYREQIRNKATDQGASDAEDVNDIAEEYTNSFNDHIDIPEVDSTEAKNAIDGMGASITDGLSNALDDIGLSSLGGMDLGALASILGMDPEKITGMGELFNNLDLGGVMGGQMTDLTSAITKGTPAAHTASEDLAEEVEEPITSMDSKTWGSDMVENYIEGMRSKFPELTDAAEEFAQIQDDRDGFSEPKKGPLSDFHKSAPDMIALWCKGIRDNLWKVEDSSSSMASRIKEGLTSALDYVSSLIDGGMTDELTIRPIMDLSEIQNGIGLLDSMLSGHNNSVLYGTKDVTASAAYGMKPVVDSASVTATPQVIEGDTYNNTFNITNNDPDAVAQRVSKIIQQQVVRKQAVWGRPSAQLQ